MRMTRRVTLIRIHPDDELSPHFKGAEFVCPHCGAGVIAYELVMMLERLRAKVGKPLRINSGYRCPEHNKAVGGRPDSYHLLGVAADVAKVDPRMVDYALEIGFPGIIEYDNFIHLDLRLIPYLQRMG